MFQFAEPGHLLQLQRGTPEKVTIEQIVSKKLSPCHTCLCYLATSFPADLHDPTSLVQWYELFKAGRVNRDMCLREARKVYDDLHSSFWSRTEMLSLMNSTARTCQDFVAFRAFPT